MRYVDVNADRLWSRQRELDRIGATPAGGVHRMALTPEDISSHRLLADWALARGFSVDLDEIGNMFVTRAGADAALPPVGAGSHLDSQPMAGRFDGPQGVLAGFEALEAIEDAGIRTRLPLCVPIWNNEEGPRFTPACMGSAVYAGVRTMDEVIGQVGADGVPLADCIAALREAIPEAGTRDLGAPFAAFLESHIEQGIELEGADNVIGIVTGMQGYRRWTIDVTGEEAHSGTKPVSLRKDAFLAATEMAVALRRAFADETDEMRFTIGRFEVRPGGISVVPGHVHFTVDMRHPSSATLKQQGNRVEEICRENAGPCGVEVAEFITSETLAFPQEIRDRLQSVADRRGFPNQPIFSRASHDARHIARLCPAGMIFIPCKDGISHNEAESADKADCAAAAQVLADVMLELAGEACGQEGPLHRRHAEICLDLARQPRRLFAPDRGADGGEVGPDGLGHGVVCEAGAGFRHPDTLPPAVRAGRDRVGDAVQPGDDVLGHGDGRHAGDVLDLGLGRGQVVGGRLAGGQDRLVDRPAEARWQQVLARRLALHEHLHDRVVGARRARGGVRGGDRRVGAGARPGLGEPPSACPIAHGRPISENSLPRRREDFD